MNKVRVHFTSGSRPDGTSFSKIGHIKALRHATACGLKDAKDAVEESYATGTFVDVDIEFASPSYDELKQKEGFKALNGMEGVRVYDATEALVFDLNLLTQRAIADDCFALASDLLAVLTKHA
jgi:hypothetical protein